MNFIVSSSTLLKQLQLVNGVIGSSVVMAILEDFLFVIDNGVLTISGTDLETSIVTTIAVESNENGCIAVPARQLIDTLKMLPEQPVSFKIDEVSLLVEITTSNGKYKLNGENGIDFPKIPEASSDEELLISCATLSRGINKCFFALSTEQMRPAMTGMLINVNSEGLTMVGTDAHRLVKYFRSDITSVTPQNVIMPKKALQILKTILGTEGNAALRFDKNNIYLKFGEVNLVCRLIDVAYPNYNVVIPDDNHNMLNINRLDLLNAIRRTNIYSSKSSSLIIFTLKGSELQLNGRDNELSHQEANEQMLCDYSGEDYKLGFNGKFLIDILSALDTDIVRFEISTPTRAILIKPDENDNDENITMLIMPNFINE